MGNELEKLTAGSSQPCPTVKNENEQVKFGHNQISNRIFTRLNGEILIIFGYVGLVVSVISNGFMLSFYSKPLFERQSSTSIHMLLS